MSVRAQKTKSILVRKSVRTSLIAITSGAMIAAFAVPAEAVGSDDQSHTNAVDLSPVPGMSSAGGGQNGAFKAVQLQAFSAQVTQREAVRAGGAGVISVQIARRGMPGVNARSMTVILKGPSGTQILQANTSTATQPDAVDSSGTWSCAAYKTTQQKCTYSGSLASGKIPKVLQAQLTVDDDGSTTPREVSVSAETRWNEDKVADDHDGVSGTDPVVGTRDQVAPASAMVNVNPPVTVRLHHFGGDNVYIDPTGTDAERTGHLAGEIDRIGDAPVAAEWKQVSGPAVTFKYPTTDDKATKFLAQDFVIPSGTVAGTKLVFRLTASGHGWADSAQTTVTIRTRQVGTFAPRKDIIDDALLASTQQRPAKVGWITSSSELAAQIGGNGIQHVPASFKKKKKVKRKHRKPGQSKYKLVKVTIKKNVVLKFAAAGHSVRNVDWRFVNGTGPAIIKKTANTAVFTAPVTRKQRQLTVEARAVLDNGATLIRREIYVVEPAITPVKHPKHGKHPKQGKPKNRDVALTDRAATATTNTALLCNQKAGGSLTFSDGASLTWPSTFTVGKACGAKTVVNTTGVTFQYNGTTIGTANVTLSVAGATITSTTFSVPQNLQQYLPQSIVNASLTLSSPSGVAVSAPFTNGKAGAFSGKFTSSTALQFLPLPSGWTSPTLTATLSDVNGPNFGLQIESSATDGSGGSVLFSLSVASGAGTDITINATDLVVITTVGGDQLDASGTGVIKAGSSPSVSLSLSCPTPSGSQCQLANNFSIANNSTITWTQGSGIALSHVGAVVGSGANTYAFTISGNYTSASSWSLTVDQSGNAWNLAGGISLSNFSGSISEQPQSNGSQFVVDISTQVNGLNLSSYLGTPTIVASIANTCPTDVPASVCSQGNVVADVNVAGTASIGGSSMPYQADALVDFSTGALDFNSTVSINGSFGPASMNISSFSLTLTGDPSGLSLGITATGTVLGDQVSIAGLIDSGGDYYLAGQINNFSQGSFTANGVVDFGYSSKDQSITLPGNSSPTALTADEIVVTGTYNVPASVTSALGIPAGQADFSAAVNTTNDSLTVDISYDLDSPVVLVGSTSSTAVELDSVGLSLSVTSSSVTFMADVDGAVVTAASGNNAASNTPIDGTIGITVGSGGASLDVGLGVDTSQLSPSTCTDGNNADVCSAFGVEGLDINTLAIAGTFSASPSVSFNADAYLPDSWTSGILVGSPAIDLGFDLSATTPCFAFQIGAANSTTNVIDIGGGSVITGTYLNLLFAPDGCALPNGDGTSTTIAPGIAFDFDGAILGTTTQININASFVSGGIQINGNINIGSFTLAGVSVQQTQITFDIDTTVPKYNLAFSGGVAVGSGSVGGTVNVNGSFDIQPATLDINLSGNGSLSLAGLSASVTGFQFDMDYSNGSLQSLDVYANMSLSVLGVTLTGSIGLAYADGTLMAFHLEVGANLNFYVGDVGGAVYVDYCVGSLGAEPTVADSCQTSSSTGAATVFQVYFSGEFQIGICDSSWIHICYTKDFSDMIVSTDTAASPPPPALNTSLNLTNPGNLTQFASTDASDYDLDLMFNQASFVGNVDQGNLSESQTVMVSSVAPASLPGSSLPPCSSPNASIQWSPSDGNSNPQANNVSPITTDCGIQVVYSTLKDDWNNLGGQIDGNEYPTADNGNTTGSDLAQLAALSQAGESDQAWNPPAVGYAYCYNAADNFSGCELDIPQGGDQYSTLGTMYSGNGLGSTDLISAATKVMLGTLLPIGVAPSGLMLDFSSTTGAAIWSPDGTTVFSGGTYPGSCTTGNVCGYYATKINSNFPAPSNQTDDLQFNIGSLAVVPQSLSIDPATGALNIAMSDGTTQNPYNDSVTVQQNSLPYLFVQNGMRLWSGNNCAPADWYSQCGQVGSSQVGPMTLQNLQAPYGDPSAAPDTCLTQNGYAALTQVLVSACSGNQWQQVYVDDSVYSTGGRIMFGSATPNNGTGPGMCLDLRYENATLRNIIDTYPCDGSPAQQWIITQNGSIMYAPSAGQSTQWCVDVNGIGANATLFYCNNMTYQQFGRQSSSNY